MFIQTIKGMAAIVAFTFTMVCSSLFAQAIESTNEQIAQSDTGSSMNDQCINRIFSQNKKERDVQINILLQCLPHETSRFTLVCVQNGKIHASLPFGSVGSEGKKAFFVQEYFRTNKKLPIIPTGFEKSNEQQNNWNEIKGIGARVIVQVISLEGNLKLNTIASLFNIGAAAEAKKVTGTISIETFGLGGRLLTHEMAVPTDISSKSISEALQLIYAVKSKLTDEKQPQNFITALIDNPQSVLLPIIPSPSLQCGM